MAFEMDYTDEYGEQYPASYWRPINININKQGRYASVLFYGFKDAANKGKRVIGSMTYEIKNDVFESYLGADVEGDKSALSNIVNVCYKLAKEMPTKATNDLFFEGASDV